MRRLVAVKNTLDKVVEGVLKDMNTEVQNLCKEYHTYFSAGIGMYSIEMKFTSESGNLICECDDLIDFNSASKECKPFLENSVDELVKKNPLVGKYLFNIGLSPDDGDYQENVAEASEDDYRELIVYLKKVVIAWCELVDDCYEIQAVLAISHGNNIYNPIMQLESCKRYYDMSCETCSRDSEACNPCQNYSNFNRK